MRIAQVAPLYESVPPKYYGGTERIVSYLTEELVAQSVAAFDGRFLAKGGRSETLEGNWLPKRVVIIEFPSMERLEAWYRSPEYAPALALRKRCAVSHLVMTEGVHDR